MRDHRYEEHDGPLPTLDITDKVRAHTGEGVVRAVVTRKPRNKAKAKQAKASRKRNR